MQNFLKLTSLLAITMVSVVNVSVAQRSSGVTLQADIVEPNGSATAIELAEPRPGEPGANTFNFDDPSTFGASTNPTKDCALISLDSADRDPKNKALCGVAPAPLHDLEAACRAGASVAVEHGFVVIKKGPVCTVRYSPSQVDDITIPFQTPCKATLACNGNSIRQITPVLTPMLDISVPTPH